MEKKMKKYTIITLVLAFALLSACSSGGGGGGESTPTVEQWTVSFDLNGGTVGGASTLADVKVTKGESLGGQYPANPERAGSWAFGGWFDESVEPYEEYDADTPITKDLTLTAKWNSTDATKWVVSFNTDGGTPASIESIQVTKGEPIGDQYPEDPVKDRHEFEGWYLASDADFSGVKYEKHIPAIEANTELKAKWKSTDITIVINATGKKGTDSVTVSPEFGIIGEEITISYTLSGDFHYNQLNFSGLTSVDIDEVTVAGTDIIKYTIAEEDATDGKITINAVFTHSDKPIVTMTFENEGNETKIYGSAPFTKAIPVLTGVSYASSDTSIATVISSTGEVTILKVGSTTITATKEEDTNTYTKAEYLLTVEPLQLTIGTPTVTKQYDGDATANVTPGALIGVVSGDTVNVHASGTYASVNVGNNISVTVVYTIDGVSAGNYIAPVEGTATGSITKANGADVNTNPTAAAKSDTTITSSVVTVSGSAQTVEYAISTAASPEPASGWQNLLLFTGLNASTDYYIFARSKENANYFAGTAKVSSAITTKAPIPDVIQVDFTTVTFAGVGISAPTGANVTSTSYTYTHTGYSQGVAFKIDIGTGIKLSDYDKISFTVTGSGNDYNNKPCNVFGALGTGAAPSYIQPPGNSNAAALTTFSNGNNITGSSPFNLTFDIDKNKAIADNLTGEIWLAIFIHAGNGASYTISNFKITRSPQPFVIDFTTVTFAGVGISAPTGANVTSTSYTYALTGYNQGVAFKIDLGTGNKLSKYDKISFTVTGSGNDYNNKPCNVFGALGTGAAPSYIQPPGNSNAAALTTFSSGNNITGSSPFNLTFTIDKNKAIIDNLSGEIWLAIFIHAGNGQTYTISNFQLF
jgi:hypothetical protein